MSIADVAVRARQDPEVRLAVIFVAAFAFSLGFVLGFLINETMGGES